MKCIILYGDLLDFSIECYVLLVLVGVYLYVGVACGFFL